MIPGDIPGRSGSEHDRHRYEGEPDEDLVASLEPDQLVRSTALPLAVHRLSRRLTFGLWLLRVYVLAMLAAVLAAFGAGLLGRR